MAKEPLKRELRAERGQCYKELEAANIRVARLTALLDQHEIDHD